VLDRPDRRAIQSLAGDSQGVLLEQRRDVALISVEQLVTDLLQASD